MSAVVSTIVFEVPSQFFIFLHIVSSLYPLLLGIVFLAWLKPKKNTLYVITSIIATFYYLINIFLLMYRIDRRFTFDFFFLWHNLSESIETIVALSESRISNVVAIILLLIGALSIYYTIKQCALYISNLETRTPSVKIILLTTIVIMTILLPQENEVVNLLKQFRREKHEILQVYYKNYQASISKNRNYSQIKQLVTPSDNIFMIHLESYNAEFSNEKISPNLINIAKTQGIFFPRIQASAVLTIRSQEVLLCGILPSLGQNLSKGNTLTRDLRCIPKILKENGYKTMYFKSHSNLEFANTANFMKNIGFDEIHSKDIMKSTDRELSWGYPEDIFYARVFEYLKKHQQEKIFAYIAVSSTNHFPFYNDEKKIAFPQFANLIPYPNPITTREKIADTTYIQDNFFGKMFTELFKPTFGNNSHLVVYGDHSWPIEIHPGNKFNENEAYQENFVSSFGIVPATSKSKQFAMGKVVSNLYSHLDIPLTILDLAGIHGYQLSGHSFFNELTTNSTEITRNSHCLVSVQPFADKYIATVQYPIKLIYNTTKNTVTEYNIQEDPHEKKSTEEHIIKEGDIISLQNCLQENNT